jgi:hypothetical protein
MRTFPILAALILLAASSDTTGDEPGWTDAGARDGVTLAYRDNPQLAAREVRATTELPYAASRILPIVCNLAEYATLAPGVLEAQLMEGDSPNDQHAYIRYAPRFLVVAARDVVVRLQGRPASPDAAGCSWSEVDGRVAERAGTVRMPLLRGAWTIEAMNAARSRVIYQIAVNPGGRIPAWLVRRGAVRALPEVIVNLRERLRKMHGAP